MNIREEEIIEGCKLSVNTILDALKDQSVYRGHLKEIDIKPVEIGCFIFPHIHMEFYE